MTHGGKYCVLLTALTYRAIVVWTLFGVFLWLHCSACGVLVLQPRSETRPLHWKLWVLTTGPPGKSPKRLSHLSVFCLCCRRLGSCGLSFPNSYYFWVLLCSVNERYKGKMLLLSWSCKGSARSSLGSLGAPGRAGRVLNVPLGSSAPAVPAWGHSVLGNIINSFASPPQEWWCSPVVMDNLSFGASQVAQWQRIHLPASAGDARDAGSVPGLGRSPGVGRGNPLQ